MPDPTHILIQLAWQAPQQYEILRGIMAFARLRPNWLPRRTLELLPGKAARGQAAVILTVAQSPGRAGLDGFTGPLVSVVDCAYADVVIERDDTAVGRLAAEHLRERGFRYLAYLPKPDSKGLGRWSRDRQNGFIAAAGGLPVALVPEQVLQMMAAGGEDPAWEPDSPIVDWLAALPHPCGIFCANDALAMAVEAMCLARGIAVPEQVAVLGADNTDLWCEAASPPLSSVSLPWQRVGYLAAEWVDRLLRGEAPPPGGRVLVAPERVVTRQSTNIQAIAHPLVARAAEIIRTQACQGLTLKELEGILGVGCRQLHRLYREHLGRTPHQDIRRLQLERAIELLLHTDLPVHRIGDELGLSRNHFIATFRRSTGLPPATYRSQHRVSH